MRVDLNAPVPNFWDINTWGMVQNMYDYKARCMLRKDPAVWRYLWQYAYQLMGAIPLTLVQKKAQAFGVKLIVERMRWELTIERGEHNGEFAMPNAFTAYFARLMLKADPELGAYIKTCKLKASDLGATQSKINAGQLPTP